MYCLVLSVLLASPEDDLARAALALAAPQATRVCGCGTCNCTGRRDSTCTHPACPRNLKTPGCNCSTTKCTEDCHCWYTCTGCASCQCAVSWSKPDEQGYYYLEKSGKRIATWHNTWKGPKGLTFEDYGQHIECPVALPAKRVFSVENPEETIPQQPVQTVPMCRT